MATIKIIGMQTPLEITRETAQKIKNDWISMKTGGGVNRNDVVEVGNWTGTYGEIKYVDLTNREQKAKDNEKYYQEVEKEYMEYRQKQLAKTPFNRAQNLNIFKCVYQAFTGKITPPEELQQQARKIQTEFFEKNPYRIYPDPILFKKMFKENKANETMIRFVESCIREDCRMAIYKN